MMNALWSLLAIIAGTFIAIQAPINADLSKGIGSPVAAAAFSFLSGTVLLGLIAFGLTRAGGTSLNWHGPALWLFVTGGVLGAVYVTSVTVLTPRLGAAAVMAFVVTGQLLAGVLLDRIGFLGMAVREISFGRVAGAVLLIAGALMIRLF
ncbi:MAG TPA: DMT family transporter [Rhizobiaceae bacterium]|nr:DMT family transporter [Rhizobiaceae bacterium]